MANEEAYRKIDSLNRKVEQLEKEKKALEANAVAVTSNDDTRQGLKEKDE